MRPERNTDALYIDRVKRGKLVPAGVTVRMLGMGGAERVHMLEDLLRTFEFAEVPKSWLEQAGALNTEKAVIEIAYSSVYGDHWRSTSNRLIPERQ